MNIWNECRKIVFTSYYEPLNLYQMRERLTEHSNHIRYFTRTPKHTLLACNYRRFCSPKRNRLNKRTAKVIAGRRPHPVPPSTTYRNRINSLLHRCFGGRMSLYHAVRVHFIECHWHGNAAIIFGQNGVVAAWGRRFGVLAFDQRRMCSYIRISHRRSHRGCVA